jgi:hypothetical protein
VVVLALSRLLQAQAFPTESNGYGQYTAPKAGGRSGPYYERHEVWRFLSWSYFLSVQGAFDGEDKYSPVTLPNDLRRIIATVVFRDRI